MQHLYIFRRLHFRLLSFFLLSFTIRYFPSFLLQSTLFPYICHDKTVRNNCWQATTTKLARKDFNSECSNVSCGKQIRGIIAIGKAANYGKNNNFIVLQLEKLCDFLPHCALLTLKLCMLNNVALSFGMELVAWNMQNCFWQQQTGYCNE